MESFISLLKLVPGLSWKLFATLIASFFFLSLSAQPDSTVVDVVVNSPNHTTLEAAVVAAGLADDLSGAGPFTVFAPTDAAFAALPEGTIPALLADPTGALADILKYHVLAGSVKSTDLSNEMTATTLLGKDITVTVNANGVFINNAKVTVADIMTDNGVVHVIDAVLLPNTTVYDIIANSPEHSTLESALNAAGLVDALGGHGPFTVFAPTNTAFKALPSGTLSALLADPTGALADILKYHVVGGDYSSSDFFLLSSLTTLLGKDVEVTVKSTGIFINNARITVSDIKADNGVVHVIDAVLIPARTTVVDVVVNSENHTTLEAAVVAAGLAEALSGDGPFTVFAPTDAAFAALPEGTIPALLADPTGALADILKYHVLAGSVKSTDLSDGMTATTLLGKDIEVTINANGVFINNAKVTVADIMTDNGVVHVIDAVLIPPVTSANATRNNEMQFRLYPNPATTNLTIEVNGDRELRGSTLTILTMEGRIISEMVMNESRVSLNTSGFKSGMYLVVLKGNNQVQTERLVIR
ncbi:MAG: T9SS type A sorting domain-containing protein [Bacteroidales bacterium]|nr:T9SS type A sorting domain-containing protein [Bacteroidales bacterium]